MKSIARFLIFRLILYFGIFWVVFSIAILIGVRRQLLLELDSRLQEQVEAVASLVEIEEDGSLSMDYMEGFIERFSLGGDHYFQVWSADGEVFVSSGSLNGQILPRPPTSDLAVIWDNHPLPNGTPGRIVWIRFKPRFCLDEIHMGTEVEPVEVYDLRENPQSVVTAAVAIPSADVIDFLWFVAWLECGVALVALLLLGFFTCRTLKVGLQPLNEIANRSKMIDIRQKEAYFPELGPDELFDITRRLNELLRRIRASFEREKLYSANVIHDLRTPVSELRAVMEVVSKYEMDDPDAERRALKQGYEIALEMDSLLMSLTELLHQRSHNGELVSSSIKRIRPVELIEEIMGQCSRDRAEHDWEISEQKETWISTVVPALTNVLRQILCNAVDYAPAGSTIQVDVKKMANADKIEISVSNENPGLKEKEMDLLFDPFWRHSADRSDRRHSGLGLSIAKLNADILGGDLSAKLKGHLVEFCLIVPVFCERFEV